MLFNFFIFVASKESYYELEKMIQAIIIEEKDLSTTQSCSENCNLHTAINHIECKELYECRYIASSLEICEKVIKNYRIINYIGEGGAKYEIF